MILKVLSRHTPNYANLIDYIIRESKAKDGKARIITHNLKGNQGQAGWARQFLENESLRCGKQNRKDSIKMYHEILSFSNLDKANISQDMLADITKKYIELRGKDAQYLSAVHYDKDHIHIHFCTSGLKFRTGMAHRLTRPDMQKLKIELQQYHKEKYPQIEHSFPKHMTSERTLLKSPLAQEALKYSSAEEFIKSQTNAYHGTAKSFDCFDEAERTGSHGESSSEGFFFSEYPDIAFIYARETAFTEKLGTNGEIMPVHLAYANAKYLPERESLTSVESIRTAKKEGYDAVIDTSGNIVIFNKENIKTTKQLSDFYNQTHAVHALLYKEKRHITDRGYQKNKKNERGSVKEFLKEKIRACLVQSKTQQVFLDRLRNEGLHHYERNGVPQGITHDNLKFRFSRLDISKEQFASLPKEMSQEERALKEIQNIRSGMNQVSRSDRNESQKDISKDDDEISR